MSAHDSGEPRVPTHDEIGELVKLGGPRPVPAAEGMARARVAARAEWRRIILHRGWRLWWWGITSAAVAAGVCGIAAWAWLRRPDVPPDVRIDRAQIATLQRVVGGVHVASEAGRAPQGIGPGDRVRAGDRLEVPRGSRAAFALASGISVRLDEGTRMVAESADRLRLEGGTVYVDSGAESHHAQLEVVTPLGRVSHLGTQFEVRLDDGSLRIRVREGEIAVRDARERWTSRAGEALLMAPGRPPQRTTIPTSGPEWGWVVAVAEPFRLEGATVSRFLEWVSREQGWRWAFDDARTRSRANAVVLHGSIEGLTPEEALAAVLPASGMTSRRDGDRLIVSSARPTGR